MDVVIPQPLVDAINENKVIFFLGAGSSMNAGLPSWSNIVRDVLISKKDYIDKASSYLAALDDGILSPAEVLDKIESSKKYIYPIFESSLRNGLPSELHKKLACISKKYITTNYDNLIESCFDDITVIDHTSEYNLSKIDSTDSFVLKIHGDCSAMDQCIIFSNDYEKLYAENGLAKFQLEKLFSEYTVVFIGFSFQDQYVKTLFELVSKLFKGYGREHYIFSQTRLDVTGINTLLLDNHNQTLEYLESIAKAAELAQPISSMKEGESKPLTSKAKDGTDAPPQIEGWAGRHKELSALQSTVKIIFITGFGGQGKSALAACYLEKIKSVDVSVDWRDFKEESHNFDSKIISMILLVCNKKIIESELVGLETEELISIFFTELGNKRFVFVLDNIDSYIDMETFFPLGKMALLFLAAKKYDHKSKFIFTCRPFIHYAAIEFYQVQLSGLPDEEVLELFKINNLSVPREKINEIVHRTQKLTNGHPLWIRLIVAQSKRGQNVIYEFLDRLERKVEIVESDISTVLSQGILSEVWDTLNEKQKTVLRCLAEMVRAETVEDFGTIISEDINHNQYIKSLRTLRSLNLIVDKENGTFIELHPLVKSFIQSKYPRADQHRYIAFFIDYYDKTILFLKPKLGLGLSFSDFQNWTSKIELNINRGDYKKAHDTLREIIMPINRSGYLEEFVRVYLLFCDSFSWTRKSVDQLDFFPALLLSASKNLIEYGETEKTKLYINKYSKIIDGKSEEYLLVCAVNAYSHWFSDQYKEAISTAEEAEFLLGEAKFDDKYGCRHILALALRDSGIEENIARALKLFLQGEELERVIFGEPNPDYNAPFYGNIGRCLELQGNIDAALRSYGIAYDLIRKSDDSTHLLNLGFASDWIASVLSKKGLMESSFYFLLYAEDLWRKSSPVRANLLQKRIQEACNTATLNSIFSLEKWRIEKRCNELVGNVLSTFDNETEQVNSEWVTALFR